MGSGWWRRGGGGGSGAGLARDRARHRQLRLRPVRPPRRAEPATAAPLERNGLMHRAACLAALALLLLPARAGAKTYRYKGGPPPEPDTVYSVSSGSLEPIVRSKGPRVPLTNLELVRL